MKLLEYRCENCGYTWYATQDQEETSLQVECCYPSNTVKATGKEIEVPDWFNL